MDKIGLNSFRSAILIIFSVFAGKSQIPELSAELKAHLMADSTVLRVEYITEDRGFYGSDAEGWIFYSKDSESPDDISTYTYRVGKWSVYRMNGTKKLELFIPFNKYGIYRDRTFDRKGKIRREVLWQPNKYDPSRYKKGYKEGITSFTFFYKNGKVQFTFSKTNGVVTGYYRSYFKNGVLSRYIYRNELGQKDGSAVSYHPNGNTYIEKFWSNGKKVGTWKWYEPDGTIKKSKSFD